MRTFFILLIMLLPVISLAQIGGIETRDSTHTIYFEGKYYTAEGHDKAKAEWRIDNYEAWFLPGLGYTYYTPEAEDSLGSFSGISVEYLIFGQVHKNDKPGPSHVRFYAKLNILNSSKEEIGSMFLYTLGLDLSLEKNPKRDFLVPYFGLEFGGISQKNSSTTAQFTPLFGLRLLAKKNLFINVQAGYMYPISNFETMQGWSCTAGINFALW